MKRPDRHGLQLLGRGAVKADLTFLTSEPMQGRLSLEGGSEVAIHWIAAEFAKARLKLSYKWDRDSAKFVARPQPPVGL